MDESLMDAVAILARGRQHRAFDTVFRARCTRRNASLDEWLSCQLEAAIASGSVTAVTCSWPTATRASVCRCHVAARDRDSVCKTRRCHDPLVVGIAWQCHPHGRTTGRAGCRRAKSPLEAVVALLAAGADVNASDCHGDTLLHRAAQRGDIAIINAVLASHCVDLDRENGDGDTALALAARWNHEGRYGARGASGHVRVASSLLNAGASLMTYSSDDASGYTPIHWAADVTSADMLELLLQHGADANVRTHSVEEQTPLHVLLAGGRHLTPHRAKALDVLIQYQGDLTLRDANGDGPLDLLQSTASGRAWLQAPKTRDSTCNS